MAMNSFEAALNLLREARRTVKDVRWDIVRDEALKRDDPSHHHQLMVQTQAEQTQLTAAIDLLERVEAGDLVVMSLAAAAAAPDHLPEVAKAVRSRPMRQHGLFKRTPEATT